MATFSTLPTEIHDTIADLCAKNDLINLCCTSKWLKDIYLRILYRNVDIRLDRFRTISTASQRQRLLLDERRWQQRFVLTLLSRPEYGKHVRSIKSTLCFPSFDHIPKAIISDEELWSAMHSLTHVQSVNMCSTVSLSDCEKVPTMQFPINLFCSATSVTLVGSMQYHLAKAILIAINPGTLRHLCLDVVRDCRRGHTESGYVPGDRDEDGRMIAFGATSGLLTLLTGRCTALRTLELRRMGQSRDIPAWHRAAEDASYMEWASFIRSVQGTVEKFTFEHTAETAHDRIHWDFLNPPRLRIMDERFLRLVLPTIVSENWPCLTLMELQGVRCLDGQVGQTPLMMQLRAVLDANTKIVVEEKSLYFREPA
ncbi:hypothetical protein MMC07_006367 [Pseudocyphellaria aurata]|nr:hypothetical protein [Pseudocyphellaria aurata]